MDIKNTNEGGMAQDAMRGSDPEEAFEALAEDHRRLRRGRATEEVLAQVIADAVGRADRTDRDMSAAATDAARAFKAGIDAFDKQHRSVLAWKNYAPANLSLYTGDDYPVAGCTVVIELTEKGWAWIIYAPGYEPGSSIGVIESRFSRPHGSTGIAIDALIRQGSNLRPIMPEMVRAERAYASSSESAVTSKA